MYLRPIFPFEEVGPQHSLQVHVFEIEYLLSGSQEKEALSRGPRLDAVRGGKEAAVVFSAERHPLQHSTSRTLTPAAAKNRTRGTDWDLGNHAFTFWPSTLQQFSYPPLPPQGIGTACR